ncbi:MAG: DUF1887 family CARF protein [Kiritimatiellae bacterium]|nr:DUF1887 family CARF protein [Kiritimatiellia bacterium]
MSKFKTHVVILSDQVLPNVLPVLDYTTAPELVIICENDAMHNRGLGTRMIRFLETKNIRGELFRVGGGSDFKELQKRFQELATRLGSRAAEVAVNLSGGNKLMSCVAQNVFAGKRFTCFYGLPAQGELVELSGGLAQFHQLRDKLKLTDFFKVHGYTVLAKREKNLKLISGSHALCRDILADFSKYGRHIAYLNRLAAGAENHFSLKAKANITPDEAPLFELFARHGFISKFDDGMVEFVSDEDRGFCKGGWLEDYLHQTLKSIHKEVVLQDFATSVEIEGESGRRSELDAAFLFKNKLYIVEANTSPVHDRGASLLHRLDTLKDFAGTYTFSILIALRGAQNFDRRRAQDQGVHLIQSTEINDLESRIRAVIGAPVQKPTDSR